MEMGCSGVRWKSRERSFRMKVAYMGGAEKHRPSLIG